MSDIYVQMPKDYWLLHPRDLEKIICLDEGYHEFLLSVRDEIYPTKKGKETNEQHK